MKYTMISLGVALVLLLGWEIYTLVNETEGDTISTTMWWLAKEYPIFSFAIGVLIGHFFWPNNDKPSNDVVRK